MKIYPMRYSGWLQKHWSKAMVYVFLADGFEEIEALAPVDILRRGGVDVNTVGIGFEKITGSHGITVTCDLTEDRIKLADVDAIVLPGGMPGTTNLEKSKTVDNAIEYAYKNEKIIGSICAAPSIIGKKGILNGKSATCFPGFEQYLEGAHLLDLPVVRDGKIITACGAGAALDFGFSLLEALKDKATASSLRRNMKYNWE